MPYFWVPIEPQDTLCVLLLRGMHRFMLSFTAVELSQGLNLLKHTE